MDTAALTFSAAMITGFAFGAGPCNISCLPYLGPVFLHNSGGILRSWHVTLPFTLGRLLGYSLLGLVAGFAGQAISGLVNASIAGWTLGVATMLLGVYLLRKPKACNRQPETQNESQPVHFNRSPQTTNIQTKPETPNPFPLFVMGASMTLNPCVPLTAVLTAAAASGHALHGLSLGFAFGLGAVFVPMIIFSVVIAHLGQEIRRELGGLGRYAQKLSASLLILLGAATLFGLVAP